MIACGVTRGYQDAWIGSSLSLAFRRSEKKPTDPSFLMLIAVYGTISVRNKCKRNVTGLDLRTFATSQKLANHLSYSSAKLATMLANHTEP